MNMDDSKRRRNIAQCVESKISEESDRLDLIVSEQNVSQNFFIDKSEGFGGTEFSHHVSVSSSFPRSSSYSSNFDSTENSRSSSIMSGGTSSSKNHCFSHRNAFGDEKRVSHEWYSEFTVNYKSHKHKNAFSSSLNNRSPNSACSQLEYDSHIAHMRGNKYSVVNLISSK